MKYIIFGCGVDGQKALYFLGKDQVHCFVDNHKSGIFIDDIPVVSFEELLLIADNPELEILIASTKYQGEMELQLKQVNITEYTIFNQGQVPFYWRNGEEVWFATYDLIKLFDVSDDMTNCFLKTFS